MNLKDYLKTDGDACPFCGIEGGWMDIDEDPMDDDFLIGGLKMESEFFDLCEANKKLIVCVGYSDVADWTIEVFDKLRGTAGSPGVCAVSVQKATRVLAFASAYISLTKYLSETRGGF